MDRVNCSTVSEFIFVGLSDLPQLSVFLFLNFLLIYGVTVMGSLGMITVIQASSQLHIPMYFFLSYLFFVYFCYSIIIVPKMLANMLGKDKIISFLHCMVQSYLFCIYSISEVILLAVIAYDHFVTICNALMHMVIMSWKFCMELVSAGYFCGARCSLVHVCLALEIPSYISNVINHFFCDLPPIFSLACSDESKDKLVVYIVATFIEIITIMITLTILRTHSAEGRHKAFPTCASHLTAIVVFQGAVLFLYCRPCSYYSLETDKVATVFYTVVIPMLNPVIYNLRIKDLKATLRKMRGFKLLFQRPSP